MDILGKLLWLLVFMIKQIPTTRETNHKIDKFPKALKKTNKLLISYFEKWIFK